MTCKPAVWLTEIEVKNIKNPKHGFSKVGIVYFIHNMVQIMAKFFKLIP